MKRCLFRILSNAFSASVEMIMWYFSSTLLVHYICWFSYMSSSLYLKNNSHLVNGISSLACVYVCVWGQLYMYMCECPCEARSCSTWDFVCFIFHYTFHLLFVRGHEHVGGGRPQLSKNCAIEQFLRPEHSPSALCGFWGSNSGHWPVWDISPYEIGSVAGLQLFSLSRPVRTRDSPVFTSAMFAFCFCF